MMFDYETHPQRSPRNNAARNHDNDNFRRQLDQLEMNVTDLDLDRFVKRVNRLLETYVPEAYTISRDEAFEFDRETILYYQGEGIIDSPGRHSQWGGGRQEYGFRQILQALLLKKMLVRGLPLRRIAFLMTGMDNEVYKRLLERGFDEMEQQPHQRQLPQYRSRIEVEAQPTRNQYRPDPVSVRNQFSDVWHDEEPIVSTVPMHQSNQEESFWRRVAVHPGLEIHISDNFRSPMSAMETKSILQQIQRVIESRGL